MRQLGWLLLVCASFLLFSEDVGQRVPQGLTRLGWGGKREAKAGIRLKGTVRRRGAVGTGS